MRIIQKMSTSNMLGMRRNNNMTTSTTSDGGGDGGSIRSHNSSTSASLLGAQNDMTMTMTTLTPLI